MSELAWMGRVLLAAAGGELAAALALGSVTRLTPLEVMGTLLLFVVPVGATLARLLLGKRSGPEVVYGQVFDGSPEPPGTARADPPGRTALRAVLAALGLAVALALGAAVAMVLALAVMGKPRDELLDHLPTCAGLVAGAWTAVCGAAALRIAAWFDHWEQRRSRVVLCPPLRSGSMSRVYFCAVGVRR